MSQVVVCWGLSGLVGIALFWTSALQAHDFWIEPSRLYTEDSGGETVSITLREGVGFEGNSVVYLPQWFRDFSRWDAKGGQPIDSTPGNDPAAELLLPSQGAVLVGYYSQRVKITLPGKKFDSYLQDEGMDEIYHQRQQQGGAWDEVREEYTRCAKLVLGEEGGTDSRLYNHWFGYPLELTPLTEPLGNKGPVTFELRYRGEPLPGRLVRAFTKQRPAEVVSAVTDSRGRVEMQLNGAGLWLIKSVHMVAIEADLISGDGGEPSQWESFWASLVIPRGGWSHVSH